jgi:hypothetical protein
MNLGLVACRWGSPFFWQKITKNELVVKYYFMMEVLTNGKTSIKCLEPIFKDC